MKNALCLLVASLSLLFPAIGKAGDRDSRSLDGTWQIVLDRENEGRARRWVCEEKFPRQQAKEIAVPSYWELIERDYEGVAIYSRHFTVPGEWRGKTVWLQFDAVNYIAEVWLNDQPVTPGIAVPVPVHERGQDAVDVGEERGIAWRFAPCRRLYW